MTKKNITALALLSGGLDSTLATKLLLDQGIDVIGIKFTSPFCTCDQGGICFAKIVASDLNIEFKFMDKGPEYLKVIRNPKYGYGSGLNPCIDCRIYILKKAKKIAREVGAKFFVTGEVLGQRPMSQHFQALQIIEKESGLKGKILRPLSAKLLPITEAETKGWVDREKLMDIQGRSRKIQLALAKKFNLKDFSCPAGGCLLTDKQFAAKLKDLFNHKKRIAWNDILLLKVGRHFRLGKNKIIVGRNHEENKIIQAKKSKADYMFEVPDIGSPTTLLQGPKNKKAITIAAQLTARYSDSNQEKTLVKYGQNQLTKSLTVKSINQDTVKSPKSKVKNIVYSK